MLANVDLIPIYFLLFLKKKKTKLVTEFNAVECNLTNILFIVSQDRCNYKRETEITNFL